MGAPLSELCRMQSPNQLARARAAYARARLALDRSRDRLKHAKGQVAARRALLDEAKCWGRLGETAERVRQALEATVADRREPSGKHTPEWKAKNSAAMKRYWAEASPEQRAFHIAKVAEGRQRAAERRRARWKRAA